jgi:uncharacterized protein
MRGRGVTTDVAGVGLFEGVHVADPDTHLTEPHDLWTSRAPEGWLERVPQVRKVELR